MDEILWILGKNGMKIVAFADDLVILIPEMILSVLVKIMEGTLGKGAWILTVIYLLSVIARCF